MKIAVDGKAYREFESLFLCQFYPIERSPITTARLKCQGTARRYRVSARGRVQPCVAGFEARAAEELGMLPDGSAIAEMLADYSVMRDQALAYQ